MNFIKTLSFTTLTLIVSMLFSQQLHAHMMVAQHGSLNVVDGGVFMVLSLPVSAFAGIDDDQDGKLSPQEFAIHRAEISEVIHSKVVLKDNSGKLALKGMMLSPVTAHHAPKAPASQLVVMGRFTLVDSHSELEYQLGLFGNNATEQTMLITATRKEDGSKQKIELSPKKSNYVLFK
ncbi:hypothetical protein [Colwellia psychrerythraea]|uniref:EF-hand domain-containing protein n=1 Tax=Colwellia psychrerythraea TaxID=28229 RepID=A0A099KA34_COLPS|nr:hypothetical protein [Colwellia psychrerythraea]KGJ86483.1 hypothetical protein GAB14E_0756 [Colwellia psychrerythraea]